MAWDIYQLKRIDEFENLSFDQLCKIRDLLEKTADEKEYFEELCADLENEKEDLENEKENAENEFCYNKSIIENCIEKIESFENGESFENTDELIKSLKNELNKYTKYY